MGLHKEGRILLSIALIIIVVINALFYIYSNKYTFISFLITSTILYLLVLQFFRNPKRKTPSETGSVIAPADGKVVVIEEVYENEFLHTNCIQVSIFMSPFNVHVNRSPISGSVEYFKYHKGKYLVAWHPKSSTENERTTLVIKNNNTRILLRQIAGALAKRIRWYVKEGDEIQQGNEFGFIKFGSRVDVFLPLSAKINVRLGEKTKGGVSILAYL